MKKLLIRSSLLIVIVMWGTLFFGSFIRKERIFYIPQIDTYIKIVEPSNYSYGYVFFSKDCSFINLNDYFKVYKISICGITNILFDPAVKNEFFVRNYCGKCADASSDKYRITCDIEITDTTFFNPPHNSITTKKKPYKSITIRDAFNKVYLSSYNDTSMTEIFPIKQSRRVYLTRLK